MKNSSKMILAILAIGLFGSGFFYEQAQAAPINGNITFGGSVELNTSSAATATGVILNGWHGGSTTPISGAPQVESVDGDFATFVTVGDGTAFASPWSFNSGAVPNFWSVDGFTFDLISSAITNQGGTPGSTGFVFVTGTGTASGHGFDPTVGIFRFSTQDPPAGMPPEFSFSASSAVPEASTVAFFAIGVVGMIARQFQRRKAA
jgi:PEP-CTERM motif